MYPQGTLFSGSAEDLTKYHSPGRMPQSFWVGDWPGLGRWMEVLVLVLVEDDEDLARSLEEVVVMVVGGERRRSSRLRFSASLVEERRLMF